MCPVWPELNEVPTCTDWCDFNNSAEQNTLRHFNIWSCFCSTLNDKITQFSCSYVYLLIKGFVVYCTTIHRSPVIIHIAMVLPWITRAIYWSIIEITLGWNSCSKEHLTVAITECEAVDSSDMLDCLSGVILVHDRQPYLGTEFNLMLNEWMSNVGDKLG